MPISLDRVSGIVSAGVHLFKVIKVREDVAGSGNECVYLTCECQDGADDKGKQVLFVLTLTESARFKVDEFLDAIDAPRKGVMDPQQFKGKLFKALCEPGVYEGRDKTDFKKLMPATATTPAPVKGPGTLPSPKKKTDAPF